MEPGKRTEPARKYRWYTTAKFSQRNIPYTFALGDGKVYDGFLNRVLEKDRKYKIFVRAVVESSERVGFGWIERGRVWGGEGGIGRWDVGYGIWIVHIRKVTDQSVLIFVGVLHSFVYLCYFAHACWYIILLK